MQAFSSIFGKCWHLGLKLSDFRWSWSFREILKISFILLVYLCWWHFQTKHRKNKLLFLDIAGKSLLYLKKSYPNNKSINSLFLFLDYFIEINSKDLTHMDLESFSVPYDVIRAQIVKTMGDESGTFTDYRQVVDDEAPANNGNHSAGPSGGEEMKTNWCSFECALYDVIWIMVRLNVFIFECVLWWEEQWWPCGGDCEYEISSFGLLRFSFFVISDFVMSSTFDLWFLVNTEQRVDI